MNKTLYRSNDHQMIGGVCGGIGEYFGVDPTWIRLLAVLLIFASGFGLIAYVVGWVVIPRRPLEVATDKAADPRYIHKAEAVPRGARRGGGFIPGVILLIAGLVFLFDNLFYWFHWDYIWPLVIVGAGVLLIYHSLKPSPSPVSSSSEAAVEVTNAGR